MLLLAHVLHVYLFLADSIEKDNLTSARRMIQDLGGWPVTSAGWNENTFNLNTLLNKIRLYTNSPPLMDMYVYDDSKNPTTNILYVSREGENVLIVPLYLSKL